MKIKHILKEKNTKVFNLQKNNFKLSLQIVFLSVSDVL